MGVRFELIVFSRSTGVELDENPSKMKILMNILKELLVKNLN